jgi:hypothetical protein
VDGPDPIGSALSSTAGRDHAALKTWRPRKDAKPPAQKPGKYQREYRQRGVQDSVHRPANPDQAPARHASSRQQLGFERAMQDFAEGIARHFILLQERIGARPLEAG